RLISWQCKKQTIVATSTTEAEYVAAASCCGQVLWIQNQMLDYGFNFKNAEIYIDNESTICIVKNLVFHFKIKHIEIRHHFIRDAYEKKLIQVLKIHTDDNVADLLTKAFDVSRLGKKMQFRLVLEALNEGNFKVHEIVDFLTSCTIHHALTHIHATVDSKAVVVTEASIRSSLLFNDVDGTACLTNEAIFQNLALIGYEGDQPSVTESSSSHDTTQDSRDSLEGTNRSERDQVQSPHDSPLSGGHTSDRAEGALNLKELFSICTNLSNKVLALEIVKDAQAAEIITLPEDSTVRPDVGTADPIAHPTTTTSIFNDKDITMAQTLIKMKEEKAKEKGVSFKDIKDSLRPARSILTLKPLPTIDLKDKGKDVEVTRLVYEEELAELERETKKRQREEEASKAAIAKMYDEVQAGIEADELWLQTLSAKGKYICRIQGLYERQKRVIDDFKPMDSDDVVDKEKVLEEPGSTMVEMVPDEEREVDYEVLEKRCLIINWESKFYHLDRHGAECTYYRIFRSNGSSRWIKTFSKMVTRFDRMDLEKLYNLVMQRFETTSSEGVDMVLWGDLRTMFEETADDDLWKNQEEWILKKRRYPLIKETLERMLALRLIVESESESVFDLLRFIQKQIDESRSHDGSEKDLKELASPKKTALGKDISNPLIVDSLLKTIWLSVHHVIAMKHWLFQSKQLLVKEASNPFMAGSLPKTT
nr:putative ribonuclease H-like domain-containing protein [Tanacetum cinerariifolium]